MTPEGAAFQKYIESARNAIMAELQDLPEEALNWDLGIPETNSLFVSAFHPAGSINYFLVALIGGGTLARDRDAEFRAAGDLATLTERWQEVVGNSRRELEKLSAEDFGSKRIPMMGGAGQDWSVRECLLRIIEHANTHLGHIQLAKQLWQDRAKK